MSSQTLYLFWGLPVYPPGILSQWQESLNNHRRCVQYWHVTFPSSLSDINGQDFGIALVYHESYTIAVGMHIYEGETFTLNLDVMNENKNHLTQTHFNSKINGQTFHEDRIFASINAAADWKRGEDMNGRKEKKRLY
jgi:hypothetical protein